MEPSDNNPFQPPQEKGSPPPKRKRYKEPAEYPSRFRAMLGGARRGAIFGGKWTAITIGGIIGLFWFLVELIVVYRWGWLGHQLRIILLLARMGLTLLALIAIACAASLCGAIIVGIAYAFMYRKPAATSSVPQSPSPNEVTAADRAR